MSGSADLPGCEHHAFGHDPDCDDCETVADMAFCPPHDFDLLRQCRRCGLGSVPYFDDSRTPPS